MSKITCSVDNCSHNCSGNCNANRIDIGGALANESTTTCCGAFLDRKNYGDLTSCTNEYTNETALVCSAEVCSHNTNKTCSLDSISIQSTTTPKIYNETYCSNFESK